MNLITFNLKDALLFTVLRTTSNLHEQFANFRAVCKCLLQLIISHLTKEVSPLYSKLKSVQFSSENQQQFFVHYMYPSVYSAHPIIAFQRNPKEVRHKPPSYTNLQPWFIHFSSRPNAFFHLFSSPPILSFINIRPAFLICLSPFSLSNKLKFPTFPLFHFSSIGLSRLTRRQ